MASTLHDGVLPQVQSISRVLIQSHARLFHLAGAGITHGLRRTRLCPVQRLLSLEAIFECRRKTIPKWSTALKTGVNNGSIQSFEVLGKSLNEVCRSHTSWLPSSRMSPTARELNLCTSLYYYVLV